ncbi:MAG: SRPBCC family protein [Candidatus Binatia bacterium]
MTEIIERSVSVPLSPSEAFHLFFEEFGRWWPREYTWGQEAMEAIGIEPHVGGLCFERGPRGFRCDWGRILEWEPPHRAKLAWQISPRREPVPNPEKASVVEVRFKPEGSDHTRVTVTHGGFERHGAGASEYRAALASDQGWSYLLGQFVAAV